MPVNHTQAKQLIDDEMRGGGDRTRGWDGRLTAAILVAFGDGAAHLGRERLVVLAAEKIKNDAAKR